MPAVTAIVKRENLFQEIFDTLRQWPELERRVFYQAHYRGQSLEAISRSEQLDVEEISAILKRCDFRLHASLKNFRERSCEQPSMPPAATACGPTCAQGTEEANALAAEVNPILKASRISRSA